MRKESLYEKYSPVQKEVIDYIYKCGYDDGFKAATLGKDDVPDSPVKELDAIPEVDRPVSQRSLIRDTVSSAYKTRIKQFELEDERYNYRTLYGSARDAMLSWFQKNIFMPAFVAAQKKLRETAIIGGGNRYTPTVFEHYSKAITLSVRKLDDRDHIYCTLNFDYLDNIEQELYDEILGVYQDRWPRMLKKEM